MFFRRFVVVHESRRYATRSLIDCNAHKVIYLYLKLIGGTPKTKRYGYDRWDDTFFYQYGCELDYKINKTHTVEKKKQINKRVNEHFSNENEMTKSYGTAEYYTRPD